MAKTEKTPEQGIAEAAAALRDAITAARQAGYRVAMPFQVDMLDAISVSATEASASGGKAPTAKAVAKDGTLQPMETEPAA